jgi:hypothetical protein
VFGVRQCGPAELEKRLLHRVERILGTRENASFHQLVNGFRKTRGYGAIDRQFAAVGAQPPNRHSILRQRAGLVRAQPADRADRFHRTRGAREHVLLGQAPGAEREKHREHDWKLLG